MCLYAKRSRSDIFLMDLILMKMVLRDCFAFRIAQDLR